MKQNAMKRVCSSNTHYIQKSRITPWFPVVKSRYAPIRAAKDSPKRMAIGSGQGRRDREARVRLQQAYSLTHQLFHVLIESVSATPIGGGSWNILEAILTGKLSLQNDYQKIAKLENQIYNTLLPTAAKNNPNVRAQARKIKRWLTRMIDISCLNHWSPSKEAPFVCPSKFGIKELTMVLERVTTPYYVSLNRSAKRTIQVFRVQDERITLQRVAQAMRPHDYSQVVIETSNKFALLTIKDLSQCRRRLRESGINQLTNISLIQAIADIRPENYRIMGPQTSLDAIREALKEMSENQKEFGPVAVVITKTGGEETKENEVFDIITIDDVLQSSPPNEKSVPLERRLDTNSLVEKFLKLFNPLEARIRTLAGKADSEEGIHGIIKRAFQLGEIPVNIGQELLYWAIFRNYIAHDRFIFSKHLWFDITSWGFERFQAISQDIFKPKPVVPEFQIEEIVVFPANHPLEEVDEYMKVHDFSQVIVRNSQGEYDLLTEEGFYFLTMEKGADLRGKTVQDALAYELKGRRLNLLSMNANVDEARELLRKLRLGKHTSKWVALLILDGHRPVGLITINDLPRLRNPWNKL